MYNFGELLGSGSFASVYACIDLATGGRVAIKVLKKNKIRGRERKHLLEMEIEIMFVVKGLIRVKFNGTKSLCEIYKVIEDHKRVSYQTFFHVLTFLDLLSHGVLRLKDSFQIHPLSLQI